MDKRKFGMRLREARKARGMAMDQLAEELGISYNYLSDLERGAKFPSVDMLIRIVSTLDISADVLLRDQLPPNGALVDTAISKKLDGLSPKQRAALDEILEPIIKTLKKLS